MILGDGVSRNPPGAGFADLLGSREFRLLWLADAQSMLGDQLARVALSVLVFDQTHSGLATAAVYALTFLPALVGNLVLGPLADLIPRRRLLVAGDVIRAVLLAGIALTRLPLTIVAALLSVAVLINAPWKAAESALVIDMLDARQYSLGVGVRTATSQGAQLVGFAAGGVVVAIVGARNALALDAVTYLLSAVIIRVGVIRRAAPAAQGDVKPVNRRLFHGARTVLSVARLRLLLAQTWLLGLLVVPEGLAAPYAHGLGGSADSVGLLLASGPAGVLVGSVVFARWVPPAAQRRLLGPLAAVAGLPLVACVSATSLAATMALWAVSGACTAYQIQVITEFVHIVPPAIRGQGIALASAGLLGSQGVGLLLGGLVAEVSNATTAVVIAGATASLVGLFLAALRGRQPDLGGAVHGTPC